MEEEGGGVAGQKAETRIQILGGSSKLPGQRQAGHTVLSKRVVQDDVMPYARRQKEVEKVDEIFGGKTQAGEQVQFPGAGGVH